MIEVELPNGTIAEFPAGTSHAEIERVLAQQFGADAPPDAQSPAARADFSRVTGGSDTTARRVTPEPTPWIQGEGRGYGIGARAVLQGAGSLLDAVGGEAFNRMLPGDVPSYREIGGMAADRIGLPAPQDSRERIAGDIGEALTGTGLTMGAGGLANLGRAAVGGVRNRLAGLLTAQPRLQTVSTATGAGAAGAAREQGVGEGGQLAAGLAGALTPGAAASGGAATLRGVIRGADGQQMRNRLSDFSAVGASPSLGQATGRHSIQGIENLLAGGPTSSGVMTRFASQQADDIGAGLQRRGQALTPNASGERAGRAVEAGVETFSNNVGAQRRALYWQADRYIPAGAGSPMTNTRRALQELTTPNPGAAQTTARMVNPRMRQMLEDLDADLQSGGGQISYEALRRIRTQIGEQMNDFSLTPDTPARELRRLYGALSRDMEEVAKSIGPEAERAAKRANNYTRVSAARLEQVQRVIDKNGGPEAVFNAVMSGTRDGGTTLRAVMQSLPKEGQQAVTAAVIRRMGMATPGVQDATGELFSAQTFLTNWNRVSPEAKRALFDRHGPQFSRDMDRIARVAETIREGSQVFRNPSGTANRGAAYTYGAALVASLFDATGVSTASVVGGGIGANWAARALTNPTAVRWLARATDAPIGSAPAMLHELRAAAQRNNDEELLEIADQLEQAVPHAGNASQP